MKSMAERRKSSVWLSLKGAVHKPGSLVASDVKDCIKGSPLENLDVILSGSAYLSNAVASEASSFWRGCFGAMELLNVRQVFPVTAMRTFPGFCWRAFAQLENQIC